MVTCVVLRLVEGVGTAIMSTVIFSTFPVLFPKSVVVLYENLQAKLNVGL